MSAHKTHGRTHTPEYRCWDAMKRRCQNPATKGFHNYGGRGIRVCERWQRFEHFFADMGPRPSPAHSIDRIDNDGHYEPGNCRWATILVQMNNRRVRRDVSAFGRTQSLAEWARETRLSKQTIRYRLSLGMSADQALTMPLTPPGERRWRKAS